MPGSGRRGPFLLVVALAAFIVVLGACSDGAPIASGDDDGSSTSDGSDTGSNASELGSGDDQNPAESGDEGNGDAALDGADDAAGVFEYEPAPDGYLVWAHPVEPVGLSVIDPVDGGLYTTSWIREGLMEGLYRSDSNWEQQPELLASDAELSVNDNKTVSISYTLRSGLSWSDGQPLTAADVEYTHRILMEGCLTEADGSAIDVSNEGCVYPMADRTGYDLVTSFTVNDDTRFTVDMAAFYPDWRSLYPQIFAEHSYGDDAATLAANLETMTAGGRPLPSSGPLVLQSWADHSMRMKVNEQYHGPVNVGGVAGGGGSGDEDDGGGDDDEQVGDAASDARPVSGVQINFVPSVAAAVEAVTAGAADLAIVGSDLDMLESLDPSTGAVALPAVEFEHLGLNLLNPHLADPLIRRALIRAVDRRELASVYGDLVGGQISADGVGNMFWLPGQSGYQDHQPEAVTADPDGAAELIAEAGYVRSSDGSLRHPERGTLFVRLLTNSGDSLRTALQERLVEQLTAAGFEVRPESRNGGAFLTEGPFSAEAMEAAHSSGASGRRDVWDTVMFAWAGGSWPGLQSGAFRANSGANPYGFSNAEFDAEASRCDGLADDVERLSCYQELDTFVTTLDRGGDGLFVVPLVERPQVLVYNMRSLASMPSLVDGPSGGPLPDIGGFALK